METCFGEDDENAKEIYELSQARIAQGDRIEALEGIESWISANKNKEVPEMFFLQQGKILEEQAKRTDKRDVKFAFLLGSVGCFAENEGFSSFCAVSLFGLGGLLGSSLYYKICVDKAREYLAIMASFDALNSPEEKSVREVESILKAAESRIAAGSPMEKCELEVKELKKSPDPRNDEVKELKSFWRGLNVEVKRKFMEVSIMDFTSYLQRSYGKEGRVALEKVLGFAKKNKRWRLWVCRSCSEEFLHLKKFKNHLEQEHAAKFKPSATKHMAQKVDEVWARMIIGAGWEPVDTVAAVEMIKTRLEFVKAFVYENGWCKDWPLAADEERSKILKEIQSLLVLFWERKILSSSLRNWMMDFPIEHLAQFEVSEHTLTTECRLMETPQSICFLESPELSHILGLLKLIKCERDDGTELVSRAVDSFYSVTRVKEKIDFAKQFSFLLLDKRLLRCEISQFDDDGTVNFLDPSDHYAKAHAHGDNILSWLVDHSSGYERFRFPRPVRAHNLDIWVAVLRAVHFTCRTLGTKYAKRVQMGAYGGKLDDVEDLCIREDERRRNVSKYQWNKYASLLGDKCKEHSMTGARDSLHTLISLSSVRDVLEVASHPTFVFPDFDDCLKRIHVHKNLSDDIVLKSIDRLRSVVDNKILLLDSKMLLVENSRTNFLNDLIRLSVFDYRSYILRPLKEYLLDVINAAAAEADLLHEEEEKPQSKKKKHRSKKRTSTSVSIPLDKTDEHEHSVKPELQDISPPRQTTEIESVEPDNSLSSERGLMEIPSNTVNQEEAAQGMQNMPGEESLLREGAPRCNSALGMTLKALLNIKVLKDDLVHNGQPFHDDLEEQVPERIHNYLLSDLLTSREVLSIPFADSSDTAEVLVSILESWHSWKSPERESLVTRLFTLEEYEIMSCSRCREYPNYPEQSSYGIVMAADSIRDLKCAFGNLKFEDILKVIRMEDKMLCDVKSGGCGKANYVHHIISRCPPIFTVLLEWEKDETEKEISETTKALDWEIDLSRLYEGLEQNTKYRLVSMVGCGEDEEHICLAYEKDRWVGVRHEALAEEAIGNWESVVRFCGETMVRPKILFYEAAPSMA